MARSLLCALLVAIAVACGSSGGGDPATVARTIEREIWSPYCPGRLLIDCTTTQARELRAEIEDRLESGDTSEEVLDWIRRNHGEEALARPDTSGAGLVVWLVPAAIFAAGAAALTMIVKRWTSAPDRASEPTP